MKRKVHVPVLAASGFIRSSYPVRLFADFHCLSILTSLRACLCSVACIPPRHCISILVLQHLYCHFQSHLICSLRRISDTARMSADEKPTMAAPNNTTGQAETVVVPENQQTVGEPSPGTTTAAAVSQSAPNGHAVPTTKPDEKMPQTEDQSKPLPTSIQQVWHIARAHDHSEIWGVQLADPEIHVPSQIVFQKFLNAYDGDLARAKDTLTKTLDWRQQTKPLDLLSKGHKMAKFDGLGYVTVYGADSGDPEEREVFTWNIYGGVQDMSNTFGDLEE